MRRLLGFLLGRALSPNNEKVYRLLTSMTRAIRREAMEIPLSRLWTTTVRGGGMRGVEESRREQERRRDMNNELF